MNYTLGVDTTVTSDAYATIAVSGCTTNQLSAVSIFAESELGNADTTYDYPVGLSDFTIDCLNPGDTANVTIYYDQAYDTSSWIARKYIDGVYANIPGAVFGTATIGGQTVTTLAYSVTDGGALDADGVANGTIVDPAGPGILGSGSTASSASNPAAPNTGIAERSLVASYILMIVGVCMLAWYGLRKNHYDKKF